MPGLWNLCSKWFSDRTHTVFENKNMGIMGCRCNQVNVKNSGKVSKKRRARRDTSRKQGRCNPTLPERERMEEIEE